MDAEQRFAAVLAEAAGITHKAQGELIAKGSVAVLSAQDATRDLAAKAAQLRKRLAGIVRDLDGASYSVSVVAWPPSLQVSVTWDAKTEFL